MEDKQTVMIIDDDADIRLLLKGVLTLDGHNVSVVADGREGAARAREEKPDLVILDMTMPEIDGVTVLREIRLDDETRETPVIILTAFGDPLTIEDCFESGCQCFMTKPFDVAELTAEVKRLVGPAPQA